MSHPMPGLVIEAARDEESHSERTNLRNGEIEWHSNLIRTDAAAHGARMHIAELICDNISGMDDLIRRVAAGEDANAIADQAKDLVADAIRMLAIDRLPASLRDE